MHSLERWKIPLKMPKTFGACLRKRRSLVQQALPDPQTCPKDAALVWMVVEPLVPEGPPAAVALQRHLEVRQRVVQDRVAIGCPIQNCLQI